MVIETKAVWKWLYKKTRTKIMNVFSSFHGGAKEVSVKARGKAISRAIDVVEVVRRRFLPDVKVSRIGIGTDQLPRSRGKSIFEC